MSIKHILIGVEGDVSESAMIENALAFLRQQAPGGYAHLEVKALSLGGNHGYSDRLLEKYNDMVEEYKNNPEHCIEDDDEIIKVLVCDYDKMEQYGVIEREFRNKVELARIAIIMSKPKFELFVALVLCDRRILTDKMKRGVDLTTIINDGVKDYNDGCKYDFQKIPPYSKRRYQANNWFGELFDRNPVFLQRALEANFGKVGDEFYTEIPTLVKMIAEYFK